MKLREYITNAERNRQVEIGKKVEQIKRQIIPLLEELDSAGVGYTVAWNDDFQYTLGQVVDITLPVVNVVIRIHGKWYTVYDTSDGLVNEEYSGTDLEVVLATVAGLLAWHVVRFPDIETVLNNGSGDK